MEESGDLLTIAFADTISSYSPLNFEAKNRRYLVNIYDPLLRFDSTFNYETALAVAWGRKTDLIWEFHLREGVFFHNGDSFDAEDAVYSLELARDTEGSNLQAFLKGAVRIEATGEYTLEIETDAPDPVLLNKLTNIFMLSNDFSDLNVPMGTGPYFFDSVDEDTLHLKRFESYWGDFPFYENLDLRAISNIDERNEALLDGSVQVLANVPPQDLEKFQSAGITVESFPDLQVSFLMMNVEGVLLNKNHRDLIYHAISDDYAERYGEGHLSQSNQIAPSGIFGFVPDLEDRVVVRDQKLNLDLVLDLPLTLEDMGRRIQDDLAQIGVNCELNLMEEQDYKDKIESGDSDFYFFGWRYDLADSAGFFENVIHSADGSYGKFNGIDFSDPTFDAQIELIAETLDVQERRELLNQLTMDVLDERVIIPLFENNLIYAIHPSVHWSVRLDGQILASEIR